MFPGLDRTDPLSSKEPDTIPDKFGIRWFEYEASTANKHPPQNKDQIAQIDKEVTEMNNDVWK